MYVAPGMRHLAGQGLRPVQERPTLGGPFMAVTRDSGSLAFDKIFLLDLPWLDSAVFIAIVALFSMILISTFGLYGVDDILLVVQPSPSLEFAHWALIDGRYVLYLALRSARLIGLDAMNDYAIIALIYAVSFATFVAAVVDYLIRDIEVSRSERAIIGLLFSVLFMTHDFQVALIASKNYFPFMLLIYFIMAACLAVLKSKRRLRWHYPGLAALFLALNCIYQPSTLSLLLLPFACGSFT